MNNKLTYEQTITGKLEAIPLPDMADAIWSRIEQQLDLDLPTDDGPSGPPAPKTPSGGIILGGFGFVLLITLGFFLFNRKDQKPGYTPPDSAPMPAQTKSSPPAGAASSGRIRPPDKKQGFPVVDLPVAGDSTLAPLTLNQGDTASSQQLPTVQLSDPVLPGADTSQARKRRGVSGISDQDYRIVPKKDSTQ